MCMCALPACLYVYHVHEVPVEAREGIRSPGTVVVNLPNAVSL